MTLLHFVLSPPIPIQIYDTIATFRKRFLQQLKPLFVEILMLAREMGLLKLGTVSLANNNTGILRMSCKY